MGLLGNSKKSKWIIGGICVFAIVATASTGLASWVISNNVENKTQDGQITVASVTDNYIEISNLSASGKIVFGPSSGDNSGLVQANGTDDVESLTVTVSGTVTAGANASWTGLSGTFALDGTKNTTEVLTKGAAAYEQAITDNYIVAPTTATYTKPEDFTGSATFSMTFTFAWGDAFCNENPSLYFDDVDKVGTVNKGYASAKAVLEKLQSLNNLNYLITVSVTTGA